MSVGAFYSEKCLISRENEAVWLVTRVVDSGPNSVLTGGKGAFYFDALNPSNGSFSARVIAFYSEK